MRSTIGTVSVVAALLIIAFAFWPSPPSNSRLPLATVKAQGAAAPNGANQVGTAVERNDKAIEKVLDTKSLTVDFLEAPFKDVLGYFAENLDIDILIDRRVEELGVGHDSPVNLTLNKRPVRARTALELVLRQLHPELDFCSHDGVLLITGNNDSYATEVYNIAGLLPDVKVAPAAQQNAQGSGTPGGDEPFGQQLPPADQLRQVITSTIAPSSWSETGGTGAANVFATLLVIKNSPQVHREIRALLTMMEKTLHEGKGAEKQ